MLKDPPSLPTNTTDLAASSSGVSSPWLSRRSSHKYILIGSLLCAVFLVLSYFSPSSFASSTVARIDVSALDHLLEDVVDSRVVGRPSSTGKQHEGLTSLGLEADHSFHLGTTDIKEYREELVSFVKKAFPEKMKTDAIAAVEQLLSRPDSSATFPPIPRKIYQTARDRDPEYYNQWKELPDYTYEFINDESAHRWIREEFSETEIEWTWFRLQSGILRSDLLRYLLVLFRGGIYTDTDTMLLKSPGVWGSGAEGHKPSEGPPSAILGIEADVGTREDWHDWWPRPLQICQWTISGAPFHPIMIDVVRRIYEKTKAMEDWGKKEGLSQEAADRKIKEMLIEDKSKVTSVMEWTGPGVFTDSVMRYLAAAHSINWPRLKDTHRPQRFGELVILPVTGFSPGVGLFGAGEINDAEAMVHHQFAGSWKGHDR